MQHLIKLTHHAETKERAHDSQIVRAKENLKLSFSGFDLKKITIKNVAEILNSKRRELKNMTI